MDRIFVMYKLRPGVSRDDFVRFSRDVDAPALLAFPGVNALDARLVEDFQAAGTSVPTPFDVIETIDADHYDDWLAGLGTDAGKQLAEAFGEIADTATLQVARTSAP